MTLRARLLALLFLLAVAHSAFAQGTALTLCTASANGNYYASGEEIARQVTRSGVDVELVETEGSMDNLQRMAVGECESAIVQIDAYLAYQGAHRGERLDIRRPRHLYDEFVHLVCRQDSAVESIEALSGEGAAHRLLIGPAGSGGAITWDSFTLQDASYANVETVAVGGVAALEQLEAGEASCLLFVSGLRSAYTGRIDQSAAELLLASIDDRDIAKAEFAGEPIYAFADVPAGTYESLQPATDGRVETLTVRAIFIVSNSWADASPGAFESLMEGVERATPTIRERVSAE